MKEIKEEIEFLKYVYSEILMEKDTYAFVIKKSKESDKINNEFKDLLICIVKKYNKILSSIKVMLKNRNYEEKQNDLLFRMATYISLDVEKSTIEEIKKHLIHGSEVVLNNFIKRLQEDNIKSKTIINLSNRFIDIQENIIVSVKKIEF